MGGGQAAVILTDEIAGLALIVSVLVAIDGYRRARKADARETMLDERARTAEEKVAARFAAAEAREEKAHREIADLEQRLHREDKEQELQLRNAEVYMQLEVHSSEIFKFTAQNSAIIGPFRRLEKPEDIEHADNYLEASETALNLYLQSLNLFEVAARMRRAHLFPHEVFASWVAWFEEILQSWYFRQEWPGYIRPNYTRDVRDIFDVGHAIYAEVDDPVERSRAFYCSVAEIMRDETTNDPCREILRWLDELETPAKWTKQAAQPSWSNGTSRPKPPPPPPASPPM